MIWQNPDYAVVSPLNPKRSLPRSMASTFTYKPNKVTLEENKLSFGNQEIKIKEIESVERIQVHLLLTHTREIVKIVTKDRAFYVFVGARKIKNKETYKFYLLLQKALGKEISEEAFINFPHFERPFRRFGRYFLFLMMGLSFFSLPIGTAYGPVGMLFGITMILIIGGLSFILDYFVEDDPLITKKKRNNGLICFGLSLVTLITFYVTAIGF